MEAWRKGSIYCPHCRGKRLCYEDIGRSLYIVCQDCNWSQRICKSAY